MDQTTRSSEAEVSSLNSTPKGTIPCCSSKEKKILQARRQQRHSTEIGSEYHRWWVVRNVLGFETNEHIAGLLLDGFHGLLQQLVVMCGGETYQPCVHGSAKTSCESNNIFEDVTQSPSSSSSSASPPGGIENMDEFMEYKNAISHYCGSLWRLCCQQGSQLQQLDKTSPPVQEFLIRLMGYLRAAKGKSFSVNSRKKQFKLNNVRARNVGENSSSHVSLANPCLPASASHHDTTQCVSVPASNQVLPQDVTRFVKYNLQQERSEKDIASNVLSNICAAKQLAEIREKKSIVPTVSNGNNDKVKISNNLLEYSFECQTAGSNFQLHSISSTTEEKLNCRQEIALKQPFTHAHSDSLSEAQAQQSDPPSNQQQFHVQREAAVLQHLLPFSYQSPNVQKHSDIRPERNQQQWKHGQQSETVCSKTEIFSGATVQQGNTSKDNKQQLKQSYSGQPNCLENKQTSGQVEKGFSSHWWSNIKENCIYSGVNPDKDVGEPMVVKDFKMCESVSSLDSPGMEDKSVSELGFLLTDSLKMLPSIDEEISNVPRLQGGCPDKEDGAQVKSLASQNDLPLSLATASVTDRQAQGCQTNISMILPFGQPTAGGLVTNRAQSLLSIPKQRAKETQTSTSLYSEIKANANNPKIVSEVKPQKMVTNPILQLIQPAVFQGSDKPPPLTTPLGTPIILYPARNFSNDNSLASLASLVHNIVYSSYGTILKPLSLTPLSSSVSNNSHQMIPPISVSAIDNSSQRKPIAAALPVLSSQLSANKPTLVPFYISHAAVNTLAGSFSKCASLSGPASGTQNASGVQLITQPNCQQIPLEGTTSASLCQDSITSDQSCRNALDASNPLNQLKTTDVYSCSNSEFAGIEPAHKESLPSQISYSGSGTVKELDKKKVKSNELVNFSQSTSILNSKPAIINEQHFDPFLKTDKANLKPTETAVSHTSDQAEFCKSRFHSENLQEVPALPGSLPEQHVSFAKSTSKILNSLLASKDVSSEIYETGQINTSLDSLESPRNSNKVIDSDYKLSGKSEFDMSSLCCKENRPQTGSEDGNYKRLENVTYSQSAMKSRSASSSSSLHKPAHHQTGSEDGNYEQLENVTYSQSAMKSRSVSSSSSSHKPAHHRRLVCPSCNIFFCSSMDLLVHRFEQHGHVCGECDSRFLTLSRLKQHKEMDHPPVLLCSQCRFHTFRKEDLIKHSWSRQHQKINYQQLIVDCLHQDAEINDPTPFPFPMENGKKRLTNLDKCEHRQTVDKDETQPVMYKEEPVINTSPNGVVDAQKCPTKLSYLSLNTKEVDVYPSKSKTICDKIDSSTKTKESVDDTCTSHVNEGINLFGAGQGDASSTQMLQKKIKSENEHERKVLLKDDEFLTDCDEVCSGAVFPSFSRTTCDSSRSDLDTISAMYAQVSQHCHLDATNFLNTSDHQFSENEEPRLVIDTEFGCATVQCKDNQENQEKCECNDEQNVGFCFDINTKSEDKSCDPGSYEEQMNPKLCSDINNSLCKTKVNVSLLEELGDKDLKNKQHYVGNLIAGRKRERKRLVVNVKRGNPTTGCDRQSRKRRRSRNGDGGDGRVKSATDISFVKVSSKVRKEGGFLITKCSVSRNSNTCQELSEMNCGQVHEMSDKTYSWDKVFKRGEKICNVGSNCDEVSALTHNIDISCDNDSTRSDNTDTIVNACDKVSAIKANTDTRDSSHDLEFCQLTSQAGQPGQNNKASLEHLISAGKEVKKQHGSCTVELNMKPSALLCGESEDFRTPAAAQHNVPPHECRVMGYLPAKKKRLKKPLEDNKDPTMEKEAQNKLQCMKDSTFQINNYQFSDITERTSLASKPAQFASPVGKKYEMDKKETDECQNILLNQKKPISTNQTSFENNMKSDLTISEPGNFGQVGSVVGRRYECPVSNCNVTFCRRWNMKDHMMKVHAQSPLIVCSVTGCDLKFSNKRELRQHVTVDHMGKTRKYMCSWPDCSKGFFARTHLSIHMLTHTGEKPVACDICDYRCRQRTALIWHLRKHGVFHKTEKVKNLRSSTSSGNKRMV